MKPERASRTALITAAYRARATARPDPICNDPWAASLAGEEGAALVAPLDANAPHLELWVAVRTAFLDAQACALLDPPSSISQAVLLGAGLDVRAARLARDGVRWFEVDQPHTQADKLRRLRALP